jgi:toxin ParE1/3/4
MTFRVIITARAEAQLNAATDWIAERSPQAALSWYNAFVRKLKSLGQNPLRCERARESSQFAYEVWQLLFGRRRNYRALFTVRERMVVVIAIRHAAQRDISPDDL